MKEVNALRSLQRRFKDAVVEEKKVSNLDGTWLKDSSTVSLQTRVGIYQYAYWARIEESLQEDFPESEKKLGSAKFKQRIRDYLIAQPSRFASLAEVSQGFPDFLDSDLARLEWLENLSSLVEDVPSNLTELVGVGEEQWKNTCFILHPSAQFFETAKKKRLVLYMQSGRLVRTPLTLKQWHLLRMIEAGTTIGDLPQDKTTVKWLKGWAQQGLIWRYRESSV